VPLKIFRRPKVADDLREIWLYSFENWGAAQADRYIYEIEMAILSLSKPEGRRLARHYLATNIFRLNVKSHNLFFTIDATQITLVRVLHASTDSHRHLQ
jgi:toxin ParE1/3/4